MLKMVSVMLAATLFVVMLAGITRTVATARGAAREQGMMPEVVVTAEMPRLVMPTVEVRAFRDPSVAMGNSAVNVN